MNLDLSSYLTDSGLKIENNKIQIPSHKKKIKIDIGLSFDAPHSQNWLDNDKNNETIVFGFEPHQRWYNYLISKDKDNNFKDFHTYTKPLSYENIRTNAFILPIAIDNVHSPRVSDFYITDVSEGCCSLLEPQENFSTYNICKVPVIPLKMFLDYIDWDKFEYIEYLKIDVQGNDINVLKSCSEYLNKIVYITAEPETNQYKNSHDNNHHNIENYLKTFNFMRINHPNTQDPTFINLKYIDKKDEIYIWQKY